MSKNTAVFPVPTESDEQQCLFRWAVFQSGKYPELDLLYHVPNGGKRSKAEAGRFKAEGVKSGVPDLCLPVARSGFHGLYVEMKRRSGGKTSDNQTAWLERLSHEGYCVAVCAGWEQAAAKILEYLKRGALYEVES